MGRLAASFERRIDSLKLRLHSLTSLRKLVGLSAEHDIAERQWSLLENQLAVAEARLGERLRTGAERHLAALDVAGEARRLNRIIGEIELDLARAFSFFDTYMDVLTQRRTPELGPLLAGCDVLAWDAIRRDHPALTVIEPPLVFCDRGFGASIIRESIRLPDGTANPMPLIQIPYSRLKEKYNLTSIMHEAGHQALVRLGLGAPIAAALRAAAIRAGAPANLADLFGLWAGEIGPDFWTFGLSGAAEAAGIREILALPPAHAVRISGTDPHPPPYLRVLLSFAWCRHMWGQGEWDAWEEEWRTLYRLDDAPPATRRLLHQGEACLEAVTRALFTTRFAPLGGRRLPSLFALDTLAPAALGRIAAGADTGVISLRGLSPCTQLAVFRVVRQQGRLNEDRLDGVMSDWLARLGERRTSLR